MKKPPNIPPFKTVGRKRNSHLEKKERISKKRKSMEHAPLWNEHTKQLS
jgi:hypothetical protein